MAFFEQLFPERISTNMQAGPRFLVDYAFTVGGQRYTNLNDPYPLQEYSLAHPIKAGPDFEELRAFFMAVNGRDGFRFKDWSDYIATQQNTSLTLISGTTWQLNRIYVAGSRTNVRPIYKPVAGLQVFRNRASVITDITATSTITTTNGRVVITSHLEGDTYTWAGTFHVPVAFVDPVAVWNVLGGPRVLTDWADISLREIREIT